MNDTRFWNSVEKLESEFLGGSIDEPEFRSKMRRKGFDHEIIDERVEAIDADYKMIYKIDRPIMPNEITALRRRQRLTFREAATRASHHLGRHVPQTTLKQWETGDRDMPDDVSRKTFAPVPA